jgi:2-alkenal reductase
MSKHKVLFRTLVSVGAIIALAVVATLAFSAGLALSPRLYPIAQAADGKTTIELWPATSAQPAMQLAQPLAAFEDAVTEIYARTLPSVVDIEVTQRFTPGSTDRFGFGQAPDGSFLRGEGSGFVWDTDGHIVTNYHVVEDAEIVKVIFADGRSAQAEVIGRDADADLAVLQVDLPAAELKPLVLGDSNALQVGHLTFAIGNPFGQDFTMTTGIVSAIGRTISSRNSSFSIPEVIQTDASINPGNSGGPLINRQGEVIGINTMIVSETGSSSGVGFAIPINTARRIIPTLITGEAYKYAWLGISGASLTDEIAQAMRLPAGTQGALVISIAENSPAAQAALRSSQEVLTVAGQEVPYGGDVIIAIEGEPIVNINELIAYLAENTRPGDQVSLTVLRDGGNQENVTVTLGVRPSS